MRHEHGSQRQVNLNKHNISAAKLRERVRLSASKSLSEFIRGIIINLSCSALSAAGLSMWLSKSASTSVLSIGQRGKKNNILEISGQRFVVGGSKKQAGHMWPAGHSLLWGIRDKVRHQILS